ncbi:MAG: SusD/RagB family nutrient-binding outer membrane lipoprotein [Bacteroidales bacterium]
MKKYIYILFVALVFSLGSCNLDVNQDPNNLSELPSADVLIPATEVTIATQMMGWECGFAGGYWSQYLAQKHTASQFKYLENYSEDDFNNTWQEFTAGALNDLNEVKALSEQNANEADYLLAEVLQIYVWQMMTDTWGDIPYSEALQGGTGLIMPKFDAGKDIYTDLLTRVNTVLAKDYSNISGTINKTNDFIFGGDVDSWVRFANALKLKLMLRLSETSGYNNSEVLDFVKSADFTTAGAVLPGSIFADEEGKRHPMAEFESGGAGYFSTNVIASKTLLSYLESNSDPRLSSIYTEAKGGGYRGGLQGDYASKEDADSNGTQDKDENYSSMLFDYNMDIPLLSLWEQEFYIAEVYARGGDNSKAKEHYDNAVKASLRAHGISENSIIEAGAYAEWKGEDVESSIKQIALQKWVAYAKYQHWEAFLERNRTKYPSVDTRDVAADRNRTYMNFPVGKFIISVAGRTKLNGKLPASPTYPDNVLKRNNNAPPQKANVGVKVWWNQKNGI